MERPPTEIKSKHFARDFGREARAPMFRQRSGVAWAMLVELLRLRARQRWRRPKLLRSRRENGFQMNLKRILSLEFKVFIIQSVGNLTGRRGSSH